MRAGKLDRIITIDAYVAGSPDDYGNVAQSWVAGSPIRAQLVQMDTEEFLRGVGEIDETIAIFRIRYQAGVTTAARVTYEGRSFNIKEVKEIGRRHGLELRCEAVTP